MIDIHPVHLNEAMGTSRTLQAYLCQVRQSRQAGLVLIQWLDCLLHGAATNIQCLWCSIVSTCAYMGFADTQTLSRLAGSIDPAHGCIVWSTI